MQPTFIHLRCHSEYSIVDGTVRIREYIAHAVSMGMPALGLTDLSNFFGAVKFYTTARMHGVKPILGVEFFLRNANQSQPPFRLLLLCQNYTGYLRLCNLLSQAYLVNQQHGHPEFEYEWLSHNTEGLILLSGATAGDVGQALLQRQDDSARQCAERWKTYFPGRFYIELQRTGTPQQELHIAKAKNLASQLELPVVATHPIQFLKPEDFKAHEARVCIAEGTLLSAAVKTAKFSPDQYFKSPAQMLELFTDSPEALTNSVEIARRCNLMLPLGTSHLPVFPTPNHQSLNDYLAQQAHEGLLTRLAEQALDETSYATQLVIYRERLDYEIGVITNMAYAGYFLIVADFINWAKNNSVPVGPGRGSGAGSLVAYCLRITNLDPLRYSLLFERFLNPERVSMPDFDIDFCQEGRDRVIDYVKHKYGADAVSQIVTFGTMAAKAAIRDVGRVLDLPFKFVDGIAKLIPNQLDITLESALKLEPRLQERMDQEEEVAELIHLAMCLEGITRNVGMHAGGVLIAPGRISDFSPLYCQPNSDAAVSHYDKDDVEAVGLVKFDFLGLRTLTILDMAIETINCEGAISSRPHLILDQLPLDDTPTYQLLRKANTTAVFQLESRGMKDMLKQAKPDCFEDIVALVALYRPGPMDLIPDFCRRKHGLQKIEYLHNSTVPILKETYGIIIYQEQVMQIAQVVAGYTLGNADMLRRAMGKKKPEEMAKQREVFIVGAQKNNIPNHIATQLFDLMEKFASYGFNKSHAAAYALLAYYTAYLKAHYPAAYISAAISSNMNDTDDVQVLCEDALANDVEILPPDINRSEYRFKALNSKQILYGLGAIKGTGKSAIEAIQKERQHGEFADLFDFCRRLDLRRVNRRVVEALIKAGAFDRLNTNRAFLLATIDTAMEEAERFKNTKAQNSLFGDVLNMQTHQLQTVAPWSEHERLQQEKAALGFYLTGHPYQAYKQELSSIVTGNLAALKIRDQPQIMAGIVVNVRIRQSSRGRMAFVTIDDATARIEVLVSNQLYMDHLNLLEVDQLLLIEGKVSHDDFSGNLRIQARQLFSLADARSHRAQRLVLSCNGQSDFSKLKSLLQPYCKKEGCQVQIDYHNHAAQCTLLLGAGWRVDLQDDLLSGLNLWLSEQNVKILYDSAPQAELMTRR